MAFQAGPTVPRQVLRNVSQEAASSSIDTTRRPRVEDSQEWILFSPSQVGSSTDRSSQTVGHSRTSELLSLQTAGRSQLDSEALDEDLTEDGELDTLDEGLHAFQEPLFPVTTQQSQGAVLPAHDGLGSFQASSPPVLEQLWRHEQYNPKRKHDGHHRRPSSVQRRLDTIEELEAQANEDKRVRIEKWRLDQSEAMMAEVERETRRQIRRQSMRQGNASTMEDILGSTPKQSDYLKTTAAEEAEDETEPFWRRLTRKFIRDIIGIDEPLLSVIVGESLPEEAQSEAKAVPLATIPETSTAVSINTDNAWRDRLLQRIARELGVCVSAISPHPGAFTTYTSQMHDYAGMRLQPSTTPPTESHLTRPATQAQPQAIVSSTLTPQFSPTIHSPHHAATWGFEEADEPALSTTSSHLADSLDLQREREYWERAVDVRMVFRFLKDRIVGRSTPQPHDHDLKKSSLGTSPEAIGQRSAIIRQHHPLVARAHARPTTAALAARRGSQTQNVAVGPTIRRPSSSCASESVKSRSRTSSKGTGTGSRNYWDLGGSVGSGSVLASGGLWGEA
jgi:hypothetical protein